MNRTAISIGALVLVLSACSSGEKATQGSGNNGARDSNAVASDAASAAAAQIKLEPGEYETTSKVLEFSMPGMPQAQLAAVKAAMSGDAEKSHRYCVTPQEAAEGPKEMVRQMREGDCKTSNFTSTGNSVSGEMHCAFAGGASSTTTFDGTFTGQGMSMTMEADESIPSMGGKGAHMKMQVDSKRVGECAG